MQFYQKIIVMALAVAALAAGASALPGADSRDLIDPGYWRALGQTMVGLSENGWCSCS